MKVREIMTRNVFSLKETHKLDLVEDVMNFQRIRHIPVVDDQERVVGLVTHRDLLKISISTLANIPEREQRDLYGQIPVGKIMVAPVFTVTPNTDLRDAAALMIEEKIGCLPVT